METIQCLLYTGIGKIQIKVWPMEMSEYVKVSERASENTESICFWLGYYTKGMLWCLVMLMMLMMSMRLNCEIGTQTIKYDV